MKKLLLLLLIGALGWSCAGTQKQDSASASPSTESSFSFLFMTDLHLQPERGAEQAFQIAVDTAKKRKADFVMTGGDLVYDVLRGNFQRSDSLFRLYKKAMGQFEIPVYHCIGNHELFGIYPESDVDSTHPDYKYGMFERHLGPTYYSFDHKGWHFIVLNSIDERDKKYIGIIDEKQMEWLRNDLSKIDRRMPVAVVLHIPLITTYNQVYAKTPPDKAPNELWVYNRKEVLDLLWQNNLKLVLQGHMHWLEDVNVHGKTRFITGGAIAGRPSWRGATTGEEGFMLLHIRGEEVSWEYIDYGWEAKSN